VSFSVESVTYLREAKLGETKPKRIIIYGERCSGTNYLKELIKENFGEKIFQDSRLHSDLGHKHFTDWLIFNDNASNKFSKHLSNADHLLFIVIVRNPYAWLQSFRKKLYHIDMAKRKIMIKSFYDYITCKVVPEQKVEMFDYNPKTGACFNNVLELRVYKLLNMLEMRRHVSNFAVIRYEDLSNNTEQVLNEISSIYGFCIDTFKPILKRVTGSGVGDTFVNKKLDGVLPKDRKFIRMNLNESLENRLGYTL